MLTRRVVAAILALAALLLGGLAFAAFEPPPLTGHVVDTSGKLGREDVLYLDEKLERVRVESGVEIVAFVPGSLDGEDIDDVAYRAFNTWKLGRKGLDDGVLLVVAPAERRVRIETGKGVGDKLTDLQTNDIIRNTMAPLLREDRFREAIDRGTTQIAEAIAPGAGEHGSAAKHRTPTAQPAPSPLKIGIYFVLGLLALILAVVSPGFRRLLFFFFLFGRGGGGGFGGGGGGGGFSGGGGRSGGGGSSDGY